MQQENPDQSMIEKVLQRLDTEVENGAMRVTVEFDDEQREAEKVSHKGCKAYGQDAAQTVGKLDAYSDQLLREIKIKIRFLHCVPLRQRVPRLPPAQPALPPLAEERRSSAPFLCNRSPE